MKKLIFISIMIFFVDACPQVSQDNIFIDSLVLDLDLEKKIAKYRNEVVVNSGNLRLECDKMDMFFNSDGESGSTTAFDSAYSINEILFFDNIVLNSGDKIINAQKGKYIAEKRVIYFWDDVKIKDGPNYLVANHIKYDVPKELVTILNDPDGKKSKKSSHEGRVRIILEDSK